MHIDTSNPHPAVTATRVMVDRRVISSRDIDVLFATEKLVRPTEWSFHENRHTFVVHLAGALQSLETEFVPGPSTDVLPGKGDLWTIPAACRYSALAKGDRVQFAEISIPVGQTHNDLEARVGQRDAFLHQCCLRLLGLADRQDDLGRMAMTSLLDALRLHLVDSYLGRRPRSPSGPGPVPRSFTRQQRLTLTQYVSDSLAEPMAVSELAKLLNIPKSHLFDGFKASFGNTPWRYILSARLSRAKFLLESTDDPVTVIAGAAGFSSPSHFATTFVRHYGQTPSSFRRSHQSHQSGLTRTYVDED